MERMPITNIYGYIYITTCLVNGKRYIGQHEYHKPEIDKKYLGSGKYLRKAINKYGRDNFTCEIIDWANNREELDEKEIMYIMEYNAVDSSSFYNVLTGGEGVSAEDVTGEKNPMFGNGYRISGEKNGMFGRKHSEESKAKMKEKAKNKDINGKNNPCYGSKHPNSRQVAQISKDGETIKIWESMGQAEAQCKYYKQQVLRAIRNNTLYKDCYWRYVTREEFEEWKENQSK